MLQRDSLLSLKLKWKLNRAFGHAQPVGALYGAPFFQILKNAVSLPSCENTMIAENTHHSVEALFADPSTLPMLSVNDLSLIFQSLKRNGFIIGVSIGDIAELEDGQTLFSLLGKNDYETKHLMSMISCAFARNNKTLINTVETGTFSHYEHLLQTEKKQTNEQFARIMNKMPKRPSWLKWLYQHEHDFYNAQLEALHLYERRITAVIDELALMYDTLPYPAFSARNAYEALTLERPACFHVKSHR